MKARKRGGDAMPITFVLTNMAVSPSFGPAA